MTARLEISPFFLHAVSAMNQPPIFSLEKPPSFSFFFLPFTLKIASGRGAKSFLFPGTKSSVAVSYDLGFGAFPLPFFFPFSLFKWKSGE